YGSADEAAQPLARPCKVDPVDRHAAVLDLVICGCASVVYLGEHLYLVAALTQGQDHLLVTCVAHQFGTVGTDEVEYSHVVAFRLSELPRAPNKRKCRKLSFFASLRISRLTYYVQNWRLCLK